MSEEKSHPPTARSAESASGEEGPAARLVAYASRTADYRAKHDTTRWSVWLCLPFGIVVVSFVLSELFLKSWDPLVPLVPILVSVSGICLILSPLFLYESCGNLMSSSNENSVFAAVLAIVSNVLLLCSPLVCVVWLIL